MKKTFAAAVSLALLSSVLLIAQAGWPGIGGAGSGSSGGGGGAASTATFVTKTPEATLSNSYAIANGIQTTSTPLNFSQTWNNAGTTFDFLKIVVTNTAADTESKIVNVLGGASGTTKIMCLGPCNSLDYNLTVTTLGPTTNGEFHAKNGQMTIDDARYYQWQTRGWMHFPVTGGFSVGAGSANEYALNVDTAPALTSGWGTGATISGNNSVGRVTIGTTPGGAGVLTFGTAFTTNAPHCDGINETTGVVIPVTTVTTAAVTFTGTFNNTDKFSYHCIGWHAQ